MSDIITQSQNLYVDMCAMDYKVVTIKKNNVNGQKILVSVTKDGKPYPIPNGVTVRIRGRRPDGQPILDDCTYSGNVVTIEISSYILAKTGNAECELCFTYYDSDGVMQLVTSSPFTIHIPESPFSDMVLVKSEPFSALTNMEQQIKDLTIKANNTANRIGQIEREWVNNYKPKIEPIVNSGNAMVSDMSKLRDELTTGENDRKSAESDRISAEQDRSTAESNRILAEQDRIEAERERKEREAERIENEKERVKANASIVGHVNDYSIHVTSEEKKRWDTANSSINYFNSEVALSVGTQQIPNDTVQYLQLKTGDAFKSSVEIDEDSKGISFTERGTYIIALSLTVQDVSDVTGLKVKFKKYLNGSYVSGDKDYGNQFITLYPSVSPMTYTVYFMTTITSLADAVRCIGVQSLGANDISMIAPSRVSVIQLTRA